MKKLITALFCSMIGASAFAQWVPTTYSSVPKRAGDVKATSVESYYTLDLAKIRLQLRNAHEMGSTAQAVEISLPTLSGKVEKFSVYSSPVFAKDLADQYQLGSYVGVGIDDPTKFLRFSVAPTDFQSMIIKGGEYEFIEPANADKTVYRVHPKSQKMNSDFYALHRKLLLL
ncbi:hypothetical protein [Chryseobacterium sp. 3008163]|uniref:hypothetical protein n=1 Tax=Chryseobacterium sp. 3008163 TaxID=2478663 RepID=UPI001E44B902|nr:hypothetical protein [Chryseobacterium sp. 3008163]